MQEKAVLLMQESVGHDAFLKLIFGVNSAARKGRLLFWQETLLQKIHADTGMPLDNVDNYVQTFKQLAKTTAYPNCADNIDESDPGNLRVLNFLSAKCPDAPKIGSTIEAFRKGYHYPGAHPDIIEHVWSRLCGVDPKILATCIYGCPSAVNAENGHIVAIAAGMKYFIRVDRGYISDVEGYGYDKLPEDLQETFGESWFLGEFVEEELEWF